MVEADTQKEIVTEIYLNLFVLFGVWCSVKAIQIKMPLFSCRSTAAEDKKKWIRFDNFFIPFYWSRHFLSSKYYLLIDFFMNELDHYCCLFGWLFTQEKNVHSSAIIESFSLFLPIDRWTYLWMKMIKWMTKEKNEKKNFFGEKKTTFSLMVPSVVSHLTWFITHFFLLWMKPKREFQFRLTIVSVLSPKTKQTISWD